MAVKFIEHNEVDATTTEISGENKVTAKLLFTEKEATVPISSIEQLLFRQLDNANQIMACTGILVGDTWYGDRPDDGAYTDPFNNRVLIRGESTGTSPVGGVTRFLYNEGWQGNTIVLERWDSDPVDLFVRTVGGISVNQQLQPSRVENTTLNGQPAKNYVFELGGTSVRFQNEEHIDLTINGKSIYTDKLPRIAFENSLGTFGVEGVGADDTIQRLEELTNLEPL